MSSITAEMSSKFMVPMLSAKNAGIDGPAIAPVLAPVAMTPNSRGAWSRLNSPDM